MMLKEEKLTFKDIQISTLEPKWLTCSPIAVNQFQLPKISLTGFQLELTSKCSPHKCC